ncbi:MAG: PAS domain-containing protein [bacterium]
MSGKLQKPGEQRILDLIINNLPAMVFYKNLDGQYISANNSFCKQLATSPASIIGKTDFDFYEKERAEKYKETDLEVIKSGQSYEGFEEEITIEGVQKVFTTRKVLVKDELDLPSGIIGLVYDVTKTTRTEEELIESRSRYKYMYEMFRLMADNIPDLLWAKDLKKRYIFVNKAICEKLLMASDTNEPVGKDDMFFAGRERKLHPDDKDWHTFGEICSDSDDITIQCKAPGRFEEFGNIKGQLLYLDVHKAPIRDEEGNMIGIVGSGRDITKEKLIERELIVVNERNKAILKALPDIMFLYDMNGNFLDCYATDPAELLAPIDQVIGHNISEFFPSSFVGELKMILARCISSHEVQTMEYELVINGKFQYFEARHVLVDSDTVLSISRNITDRKILQKELISAKEKAEESDRLKSTLLNNMSHELRTPLNGILGFSEILAEELSNPDYTEMARHINNSGKRLMRTLDAIMQLSQLESGMKALNIQKTELDQIFRQIMSSYNPQARAKGLFLELRELQPLAGYLDQFFFTQAISNILDNALKFTREGGVTITVEEIRNDESRLLSINIDDTGIGISPDHLRFIFEEFRQVSEGHNRSFEGTGLGLTIAKKMIHLLGGTIEVNSQIGKGSHFRVLIPFLTEKPGAKPPLADFPVPAREDKPSKKPVTGKPEVLLVEDNDVNMQLTRAYLNKEFIVDWAPDGPAALEKVRKRKYAAILMDINLGPGMDGIQASQAIRKIKGYEKTPIIALTGYTLFGDKERLIEGGCTSYLAKPFSRESILKEMRESVGRQE